MSNLANKHAWQMFVLLFFCIVNPNSLVIVSMTHEAYSIRPWMSFSSATVFEVNKNNVVAMAPLGEGYYEGYENLKNGYFNKPMGLPSSDFEEYYEENEEPPMDEDTLKEMIDEVLEKRKGYYISYNYP